MSEELKLEFEAECRISFNDPKHLKRAMMSVPIRYHCSYITCFKCMLTSKPPPLKRANTSSYKIQLMKLPLTTMHEINKK